MSLKVSGEKLKKGKNGFLAALPETKLVLT